MIYVLGIHHQREQFPHQRNDAKAVKRLQTLIREFCAAQSLQLLAEEWSDDAMVHWSVSKTFVEDIAADLGIDYVPCDPNLAERAKLGMKSRQDISEDLGLEFYSVLPNTEEEKRINEHPAAKEADAIRERYWLTKLIEHNCSTKTCLLVCGYMHVDNFIDRANSEGYQATKIIA